MNKTIITIIQIIIFLVFLIYVIDGDRLGLLLFGIFIGWWFTRDIRE